MSSIAIPSPLPSPTQDSEKLRKAFQGWGADEKPIINILSHRDATQRMKICQAYQQLYNESLIDRLKSELSGDLRKAMILWTMDPPQRDAKLIKDALKKKEVQHLSVIIEIACASSPHHLIAVRQAYCHLYNCSLEEDIELHVPQPLRKLLVGMVSSYRYDREEVDGTIAKSEADRLHDAIEEKKMDQEHVVWILCTRNRFQLKATFVFYEQDYGKPIDKDIKDSSDSDFATLLRTAVGCIGSPEKHFAEWGSLIGVIFTTAFNDVEASINYNGTNLRNGESNFEYMDNLRDGHISESVSIKGYSLLHVIKSSVNGLGTDESSLTRALVTRAEIDLLKIKEEYQKLYKTSLLDAVVGDTSGDYKKFLLALIGDGKLQWLG